MIKKDFVRQDKVRHQFCVLPQFCHFFELQQQQLTTASCSIQNRVAGRDSTNSISLQAEERLSN